jgi:hypothetical protein
VASSVLGTIDTASTTANFTPTDGSIPQDVTVNGAISTMASMFTLGFLLALSFVWLTVGLPSLA